MATNSNKCGMTLLETIIALSVFMVGSVGICSLITQSKKLSDSARDHYIAVNLAKNRMERARNMEYNTLSLLAETNQYLGAQGAIVPEKDAQFKRSTSVFPVISNSNLTEVVVDVHIKNRGTWKFDQVKEEIRTYFTEYQNP